MEEVFSFLFFFLIFCFVLILEAFKLDSGFPGGSVVKNPPANAEATGLIPGSGRSPGRGNGNSLQYFRHGQRSLAGYNPKGPVEWDMTEVT